MVFGGLCNAAGEFFESIASAFKFQQCCAVHEPIDDSRGGGVVPKVFAPVIDESVGGEHDGGVAFVALMHDAL